MAKNKKEEVDKSYRVFSCSQMTGGSLDLKRLKDLCTRQMQLEDELAAKEKEASDIKQRLRLLSEEILPQLFDDNGIKTLTLDDDSVAAIKDRYSGKIQTGDEEEAYGFLEETNNDNIITNTFTIVFGKDKEKEVRRFIRDLDRRKIKLDWELKRSIHHSRLSSWIKERVQSSLPLDFRLFNVFELRKLKIKRRDS